MLRREGHGPPQRLDGLNGSAHGVQHETERAVRKRVCRKTGGQHFGMNQGIGGAAGVERCQRAHLACLVALGVEGQGLGGQLLRAVPMAGLDRLHGLRGQGCGFSRRSQGNWFRINDL